MLYILLKIALKMQTPLMPALVNANRKNEAELGSGLKRYRKIITEIRSENAMEFKQSNIDNYEFFHGFQL